jgi:hypothetical protein
MLLSSQPSNPEGFFLGCVTATEFQFDMLEFNWNRNST